MIPAKTSASQVRGFGEGGATTVFPSHWGVVAAVVRVLQPDRNPNAYLLGNPANGVHEFKRPERKFAASVLLLEMFFGADARGLL